MTTPKELLGKAAEYLGEHGWTQGKFENDAGAVCVDGAITAASQTELFANHDDYLALVTSARKILALEICKDIMGTDDLSRYADSARQAWLIKSVPNHSEDYVWSWNDKTERSKEDVLLMLKRAAHDS